MIVYQVREEVFFAFRNGKYIGAHQARGLTGSAKITGWPFGQGQGHGDSGLGFGPLREIAVVEILL